MEWRVGDYRCSKRILEHSEPRADEQAQPGPKVRIRLGFGEIQTRNLIPGGAFLALGYDYFHKLISLVFFRKN